MSNNHNPIGALQELMQTAEKAKVKLTPEILGHAHERTAAAQAKLARGEQLTKEDVAFIPWTIQWIRMPGWWRERHPTLDIPAIAEIPETLLRGSPEDRAGAERMQLFPSQYRAMAAIAKGKESEGQLSGWDWIDHQFEPFENGIIHTRYDLEFDYSQWITELPERLRVNGSFTLVGCTNITQLPQDLAVEKFLHLSGCDGLEHNKAEVLPRLFEAVQKGAIQSLSLYQWPLVDGDIPDPLEVKGSLDLSGCAKITRLPQSLKVGKKLSLGDCPGLENKQAIAGLLQSVHRGDIQGLKLNQFNLAEADWHGNLEVRNDLIVSNCINSTRLLKKLKVGRSLGIEYCPDLTTLGEELEAGLEIHINNCPNLESLSNGIRSGDIMAIRKCPKLRHLPDDLMVGKRLILVADCPESLKRDAERLKAKGNIPEIVYKEPYES